MWIKDTHEKNRLVTYQVMKDNPMTSAQEGPCLMPSLANIQEDHGYWVLLELRDRLQVHQVMLRWPVEGLHYSIFALASSDK